MATFKVAAGTDWIATLEFGSVDDRWRLDDYDLFLHVKRPGSAVVLLDLNLDNGKLIISDAAARLLEVNVGWEEIEALEPGPFEFDVLFENRTTGVRSRSGPHSLSVTRGITFPES
jgi:hypothetical protein